MSPRLAIQVPFEPVRLEEARTLGIRKLQLRVGPGFPITTDAGSEDRGRDEARRAAASLADQGFEVIALGCYRNPLSPDRSERDDDIRRLRLVLEWAAIFEIDLIGVFAGRDRDRALMDNLADFAAVWAPLAEEAESAGVRFAFENCTMLRGDPPRGINMAMTPHILEKMFETVPSPALGIELDPSHLHKQWLDPAAFVHRFGDRILHVHAKDHEHLTDQLAEHGRFDIRASRDRLPGRGEIDFEALFTALDTVGYRGAVTLEPERGVDLPEDIAKDERLKALRESVAFLEARVGSRGIA